MRWTSIAVAGMLALLTGLVTVPVHALDGPESTRAEITRLEGSQVTVRAYLGDDSPVSARDEMSGWMQVGDVRVPAEVSVESGEPVLRAAMILVDTSGSMRGDGLAAAKRAVTAFTTSVPAGTLIAVIGFADSPTVLLEPTDNLSQVPGAISRARAGGNTALFDAVVAAIELAPPDAQSRIVVVSDGADTASTAGLGQAISAASGAGIAVDAIAISPTRKQAAVLAELTGQTTGTLVTASTLAELTPAFAHTATRLGDYVDLTATFPASVNLAGSSISLGIVAGSSEVTWELDTPQASDTQVSSQAQPVPAVSTAPGRIEESLPTAIVRLPQEPGFAPGMATVVAAITGTLLLVAGITIIRARRRSLRVRRIRQVLRYQTGSYYTSIRIVRDTEAEGRRFAALDAWLAGHMNVAGIKARCAAAEISLSPAGWLLLRTGCALLVAIVMSFLDPWLLWLVAGGALGWLAPGLWLRYRVAKRQRSFSDQLPDFLMLLASSLRSGLSFTHALETAAADGQGEVDRQMRRVMREVQVGGHLDEALLECAERMASEDLRWAVTALSIQREVGGNLSTILDTAASTIKARHEISREVRTLSAEGRLSAYVLLGLPLGVLAFLLVFRRAYIEVMWTTPLGWLLLVGLAGALVVGWVWMRTVVKVRV